MGIDEQQQNSIYDLLGAILHLGNIQFEAKGQRTFIKNREGNCVYFSFLIEIIELTIAAQLMKIDPTGLEIGITSRTVVAGGRSSVYVSKLGPDQVLS